MSVGPRPQKTAKLRAIRKWRRFEVTLPGRSQHVPEFKQLLQDILHLQPRDEHFTHVAVGYRADRVRLVVDLADTEESRDKMRDFRVRCCSQLKEKSIRLISYRIEVE
jgi:hypothetical protein